MTGKRWHSPISVVTELAWLAKRAESTLSKQLMDSPGDKAALAEAVRFLEAALEAAVLLNQRNLRDAQAYQFTNLVWAIEALSRLAGRTPVPVSGGIQETIEGLLATLQRLAEGGWPPEESVEAARFFFESLGDLVFARARQPTDSVMIEGGSGTRQKSSWGA